MKYDLQLRLNNYRRVVNWLQENKSLPELIASIYASTWDRGGTVFFCGNGGSAADAQHLAAEYVGRFMLTDRRPLRAIALTTDTSVLSAIGNDFGFDQVFLIQLKALVRAQDTVVFHSTSGHSQNQIKAAQYLREHHPKVASVAFLGAKENCCFSPLATIARCPIYVDGCDGPSAQIGQMMLQHLIAEVIDHWALYGRPQREFDDE